MRHSIGGTAPVARCGHYGGGLLLFGALLLAVTPASAQEFTVPPGQAFRTSLGAGYVMTLGDFSAPADRLPSMRVTLRQTLGRSFGWSLGWMRLVGDRDLDGDAVEEDALNLGLLGLNWSVTHGRLRLLPFLEGGGGLANALADVGGYETPEGYVPVMHEVNALAFGGTGGLTIDAILGPGITLSLTGGWSQFMVLSDDIDPLGGPIVSAGLRLMTSNDRWYWRTSGHDQAGPTIRVLAPEPEAGGVVRVGQSTGQLRILVSDPSGIERVAVRGQGVDLHAAPAAEREQADARGQEARLVVATVNLSPGENRIPIAAWDDADNRSDRELRVLGPAAGAAPSQMAGVTLAPANAAALPVIDVVEPQAWSGSDARGLQAVSQASVRVRGTVRHAPGVAEVLMNGARAAVRPAVDGRSVTFTGFVPVEDDLREVRIEARGADGAIGVRTYALEPQPVEGDASDHALEPLREMQGRRWAVIIGISDYQDPEVRDLRFADDDARAFYDFLRSPAAGLGGIPEENMLLLVDEHATMVSIRSALFTFLKQATEDDIVIFYVAAHGMHDPERLSNLYLVAHDTRLDDLAATGVSMEDVFRGINDAYARMKVVFADACHSAGMGTIAMRSVDMNMVNSMFLESVRASTGGAVTFTSAERNQLSAEGEQWGGGHGVYTHYLLEGLRGGADADGDLIVTLGEALEYTRDQVARDTRNAQIPSISPTSFDRYWPMSVTWRNSGEPGR